MPPVPPPVRTGSPSISPSSSSGGAGGASPSSAKRCAVSECSNQKVPGRMYCIFHKNQHGNGANETAPAAATGSTTGSGQYHAPQPSSLGSGNHPPPPPPAAIGSGAHPPPPGRPAVPPPRQSISLSAPSPSTGNRGAPPPPPPPPSQAQSSVSPPPVVKTPPPIPSQASTPIHASPPPPPVQSSSSSASAAASPESSNAGATPEKRKLSFGQRVGNFASSLTNLGTPSSKGVPISTTQPPQQPTPPPPPHARQISGPSPSAVAPPPPHGRQLSGGSVAINSSASSHQPSYPSPKGGRMASGTVLTMNPAIAAGMHTRPQAATISSGGSGGGMMVDNRPYAPSVALSRPPATSRFTISAAPGSNLAALFSLGTLDTSKLQHLEFFHLTHLPELISAQVDAGIYAVHRFIQVLRKMIQEADEHWKAQIKTLEHEGVKVDRMARDNMMRTQLAWSAWQRAQISIAHKHISVNAAITLHALVPLLEFHTSALLKKKELDRDFQQREKECHAAKIALQKELAACEKLIDVWKQLHAEETGGSGAASSAGGSGGGYSSAGPLGAAMASHRSSTFTSGSLGGSGRNLLAGFGGGSRGEDSFGGGGGSGEPRQSIFSKLTRAVSTLSYSSPAAVQEKLVTATIKYQEVLTSTNRRLEIFHTHELPHYLLELQQLELQRLELTEASLRSHAQLTEERERELVNQFYSTSLPDNVATMDPAADLDECINTYIDSHGFAPVYSSIPYALPVSLDEIKSGRILGNPNSVFHSTLQHLMDVQKDTHPSLPVPRFLLYTLDAIRSCNGGRGIEQEGIFRISPSKDEMEGVKRALNAVGIAGMQKSDIPTQSVYLTCALLKEWLRSLVDSCIPTKDYNACITIVKKTLAAEDAAAASAAASPPPSSNSGRSLQLPMSGGKAGEGKRGSFIASNSATSSQLASLVSSLPLVNQRVLQLLADFVDEVVEEKNQKSNRMTVDNLSIVFAPCLLRSASEDPLELLQNSKYEIKFLVLLFRTMAGAPSSQTMCVTQLQKGIDY